MRHASAQDGVDDIEFYDTPGLGEYACLERQRSGGWQLDGSAPRVCSPVQQMTGVVSGRHMMPYNSQHEVMHEDEYQSLTWHDQNLSHSSSRNPLAPAFTSVSPADHRHPMPIANPAQPLEGACSRSFERSHAHPTNDGPRTAPSRFRPRLVPPRHNYVSRHGLITNPIHPSRGWRPWAARSKP